VTLTEPGSREPLSVRRVASRDCACGAQQPSLTAAAELRRSFSGDAEPDQRPQPPTLPLDDERCGWIQLGLFQPTGFPLALCPARISSGRENE